MNLLQTGTKAPDFTSTDQHGRPVSLKDYRGRKVILYFYPKDDTPGCTKEACAFRDHFAKFTRLGIEVLGVSTDSEKSHRAFAEKYKLPFALLADTDRKIVEAYGVWGEKNLYGKKYMGIQRATFLVDETGRIAAVFPRVKPEEHPEEILAKLAEG
jgi:peroxiredoxin Q/BCP